MHRYTLNKVASGDRVEIAALLFTSKNTTKKGGGRVGLNWEPPFQCSVAGGNVLSPNGSHVCGCTCRSAPNVADKHGHAMKNPFPFPFDFLCPCQMSSRSVVIRHVYHDGYKLVSRWLWHMLGTIGNGDCHGKTILMPMNDENRSQTYQGMSLVLLRLHHPKTHGVFYSVIISHSATSWPSLIRTPLCANRLLWAGIPLIFSFPLFNSTLDLF